MQEAEYHASVGADQAGHPSASGWDKGKVKPGQGPG